MARMEFDYHPIGTKGFVADAGRHVREVVVEDVLMVMSMDRGSARHVVRPASGEAPDWSNQLWHDQYAYERIHPTAEGAEAEMAEDAAALARLQVGVPATGQS